MKKILFFVAATACLWSCSNADQEEEQAPFQTYSIEQFYKNTNYTGGSFSPDNSKLLVSSNATGIYNIYALAVDGSAVDTLSQNTEESYYAISYFPNDWRVLFTADKGGNEINHLYVLNPDGSTEDLTPGENEKASFFGWSQDNASFYYLSNKRNPSFFDLYKASVEDYSSELIYENNDGLFVSEISKDEQYLALIQPVSTSISSLHLHELATGERTKISPENADASYSAQGFSLAGDKLFFTTNDGAEFTYLAAYNIEEKSVEKVLEKNWDVSFMYQTKNEKYRVAIINSDGSTEVVISDPTTGEEINFPNLPNIDITSVGFSQDEKWMRITGSSAKEPTNIYVYDIANASFKKLTNSLNEEINPDHLVAGEVVRYPSFDGLEIPSILYKPVNASAENKVPVLVWVHGGPGGQTRLGYSSLVQYLVNHGYAIIGVNNRGSSGYGKTFYRLDDQRHGEDDLMDCVYAKDYIGSMDWADTTKFGIIGGSYGGYMVMAALAFQPEVFDVGVNIFGVTNWLRTLKSIPSWWEAQRKALYEELGDPFTEDSVRLRKISPLFHAQNVVKPLMVLQGANDPRVLQVESDEIVAGVRANDIPVEYVLFSDEGHGFRKKENEIKGYGQVLTFLNQYLKGE